MSSLERTTQRLRQVIGFCEEPVLAPFRPGLAARLQRLAEREYTIAVFGAFSAGKSSLINALLGSQILPVSPNPTTAAINRVLPPTTTSPHGTVRVVYKTEALLRREVADAGAALGVTDLAPESLSSFLTTVRAEALPARVKPLHRYLLGIAKGWAAMAPHLGTEETLSIAELRSAVAKEERAAFAERVDVYFDSAFAQAGVVLVDTPGADSIHARHTDVAFRYLRDADAVLFVTYYNHAFSEPDREFLAQLGKVKEALAADTMFFVINACDLAKDAEELGTVQTHIEENLLQMGIRLPRLYPVSSQLGVLGRSAEGAWSDVEARLIRQRLRKEADAALPAAKDLLAMSGIPPLTRDLLTFTSERLTDVAVQAAELEIERARVHAEREEARYKERSADREEDLRVTEQRVRAIVDYAATDARPLVKGLEQEIADLLFHVGERMRFSQTERMLQSFHPSVIVEGSAAERAAATTEWLRLLALALGQEIRATGIRVARAAQALLASRERKLREMAVENGLPDVAAYRLPRVPDDVPVMPHIEADASVRALVDRNARRVDVLFEHGGRQVLQEALTPWMQEQVSRIADEVTAHFVAVYGEWLDAGCRDLRAQAEVAWDAYLTGERALASDEGVSARLQAILAHWPPQG